MFSLKNLKKRNLVRAVILCAAALALIFPGTLLAKSWPSRIVEHPDVQHYAPPQFDETHHELPVAGHPAVLQLLPDWADAAILLAMLLLAAWAVLARRSRRLTLALALLALLWFGFARHGCICPVGSTQNMVAAVFSDGDLPWIVGFLFATPLIVTLFFGRVFCAAVCPLGALQDLAVAKPLRMPRALDAVLRLIPLGVLALAVVMAANDAGFPVCRTDPFVGFFRRSAPVAMLLVGGVVVLLGLVIARPYCRYYCPYGVLLGWFSKLSWRHATITPDECIKCRLCAEACPFDAIQAPRAAAPGRETPKARRALLLFLLLAPLLVGVGALSGHAIAPALASYHPDVMTQEHLARLTNHPGERYLDVDAFRTLGGDERQLTADVVAVRARFDFFTTLAGSLLGLAWALRMIMLARQPRRDAYTIDRSRCFSCGRCFAVCPRDHAWRKRKSCGVNLAEVKTPGEPRK
jgi:ferredoxin